MKPRNLLSFSPKERFLSDAAKAQAWNLIAETDAFSQVLESALAEMIKRQTATGEGAVAMSFKIEGAKIFINTLLNLGLRDVSPAREDTYNLKPVDLGASKAWDIDPHKVGEIAARRAAEKSNLNP